MASSLDRLSEVTPLWPRLPAPNVGPASVVTLLVDGWACRHECCSTPVWIFTHWLHGALPAYEGIREAATAA